MENYHELPSSIINADQITQITRALNQSYSKETAFPEDPVPWTETNRAHGHCALVSLYVQEHFGGDIVYDGTQGQYWNRLPDDTQHDFTRSQYKEDRPFVVKSTRPREEVLFSPNAQRVRTPERYEIFKARVSKSIPS